MKHVFSRQTIKAMAPLALVYLLAAGALSAIPYAVTWYTADGGGGTSGSGPYILTGTIGQPDAVVVTGGTYLVAGGFWAILMASSSSEIPELLIQWVDGNLWISWSPAIPGFRLEQSTGPLFSTWINAPPGNPVVIPLSETAILYRLCKP